MFSWLEDYLQDILAINKQSIATATWRKEYSDFLNEKVTFYRMLSDMDKTQFDRRVLLFLQTTSISAGRLEVTNEDELLVAASAIIPVWGFPKWHYFNLKAIFLLPGAFNKNFKCGASDSKITGMVGSGPMEGKMILSRPHLYLNFENGSSKYNIGIRQNDRYPAWLKEYPFSIPWFNMIAKKTHAINSGRNKMRRHGAANRAEFFAVASDYFYERPRLLLNKYPHLYAILSEFYKQQVAAITSDIMDKNNEACPCGSGKRYKRCCMPGD